MVSASPPYEVGYFVGSLSVKSINRTLAKALIRLAPPELTFREIEIARLPLYNRDFDEDYPSEGRELKEAIESDDAVMFVTPGVQPRHPRQPQERHRLGQPTVGHELVRPQAVSRDRRLPRQDRYRGCAAEPSQHPELLQLTADECPRGLHPAHAGPRRGRRRGHGR